MSQPACSHDGLISLDEALASYASVSTLPVISLPLIKAHQHILAEDVISPVELPLFDQSAVDGYALRQADIDAGITQFELVGEIRAGFAQQVELKPGQALRIFTGGQLPASADTVARQEIVQREQDRIQLMQSIDAGTDIRYRGEELAKGTMLAKQGQLLNSGLLAALSMAGVQQVKVHRQPKIAVLITGDEVRTERDNDAQVFDANGPLISSWLKERGLSDITLQHVPDEPEVLKDALDQAFSQHDLVITTGGVSVGDYDLIRPVSMQLGAQQIFWQVAQKPGKPLYFASYQNAQTGKQCYLLGLPGNPAAVLIGLHLHLATLLSCLQQKQNAQPQWQTGLFTGHLKPDSRERLLRMHMHVSPQGQVILKSLDKQQSHMLSNLANANVLVRVPAHQHINEHTTLHFLPIL
ncbi:molybdopterin molybdotransferase MoeA [Alkanindiges illinoisensis]|uniref:molybdopterin molybdotransferase MoeA n=1 Tax=Alkanindiges illinoisensis TaxID=197183 RepID=UPI00047E5549|nr:molybdopterin molybdotransferase MoeA [Alkanindiges illinoisensis]